MPSCPALEMQHACIWLRFIRRHLWPAFGKSDAIEMPRGLRINVVSSGMLEVSASRYRALFRGHKPVPSNNVGLAYAKCVEGALTGEVVVLA